MPRVHHRSLASFLTVCAAVLLAPFGHSAVDPELSIAPRGLVEIGPLRVGEIPSASDGAESDDIVRVLEQGEPLGVLVEIEAPAAARSPLELAPASGTWADAVAVEIVPARGGQVLAQARAIGSPDSPSATLDHERSAGGLWLFPPEALQSLAPGLYHLRARLSLSGGIGWSGEIRSEEIPFNVVAASPLPERVTARASFRAQLALAENKSADAAALLDAALAAAPDDFTLLCLRAEVALAGGNPVAAGICVGRASRLLPPNPAGPPPLLLHSLQQRVVSARLASTGMPATPPPEWTWPPDSVMKRIQAEVLSQEATAVAASRPVQPPAVTASPGNSATPPTTTASAYPETSPTPPASIPPTPAPDPRAVPSTISAAPASAAPASAAGAAGPGVVIPDSQLLEPAIVADPQGQWAQAATAGSQYGSSQYAASQATGAPNVRVAGNSPDAWCPAVQAKGMDWLELVFEKPVHATEVRVRQNDASGAIVKVEAFEPDGRAHLWWEGVDPFKAGPVRKIVWFAVRVPRTDYLVARVKLTLNLASGPGYKEVDAVQLVGSEP